MKPPVEQRIEKAKPDKPGHEGNGAVVKEEFRGATWEREQERQRTGPIEVVDASDGEIPPPEGSNGFGDEDTAPGWGRP